MKKFSKKRWMTLLKKMSLTEGLYPQVCGYLTPVEIMYLLGLGMRLPSHVRDGYYGSRQYVEQCIRTGKSQSIWAYFVLEPHNPPFVMELIARDEKKRRKEEWV